MRTTVELTCDTCGKKFDRCAAEARRNKEKGRKAFCGRKCASNHPDQIKRMTKASQSPDSYKWTSTNNPKQLDEFSDFRWYMKNIRQRRRVFDVDLEYLKQLWEEQEGICPLTGWELILKTHTYRPNEKLQIYHASLDRIDSSKGYIKGNVRFISVMANYAKSTWNDEELITFCKAVADNQV